MPPHAVIMTTLLAVIGWLAGCSAVKVSAEPTPDLSSYHTYAWQSAPTTPDEAETPDAPGAGTDRRILEAVDDRLAEIGLRETTGPDPDLLVTCVLRVAEETFKKDPYYAYGSVGRRQEQVLIIELFDTQTSRRVWRGVGRTTIDDDGQPRAEVEQIVRAVLARCSPGN